MNYLTIFLTGLTTGGLSCLAMQGGLLAAAITNQKDQELDHPTSRSQAASFDKLDWLPVTFFLIGKLISHTILGLLLGLLGSRLELSLTMRLIFQLAAAAFMFATAMNLLNVHPVFRYVIIKPPRFVRRLLKSSLKSPALFTPFIIGFLTFLVPCGVTQSMEVLAISSANPLIGAGIMFFFVLGTSPLFALLGVGTAKLSEAWRNSFLQVAALLLIFLSLSSLNGVLVVADSPVTFNKLSQAILDPAGVMGTTTPTATVKDGVQEITINILPTGYSPQKLSVQAGLPVALTLTSNNVYSCASFFVLPAFNIKASLAPTDTQTFTFTPKVKGRYTFTCSMGMYTGVLEVI